MTDPALLAYNVVSQIMGKGVKQGHLPDGWRTQPSSMHVQKAVRHATTSLLLLEHPSFAQDKETYTEHLERSLCRIAFALSQLSKP